jgi:hypothetical protein
MQNSNAENNKRIAKNTLFLYFRSILTLGVGLYTSREGLAQLTCGFCLPKNGSFSCEYQK